MNLIGWYKMDDLQRRMLDGAVEGDCIGLDRTPPPCPWTMRSAMSTVMAFSRFLGDAVREETVKKLFSNTTFRDLSIIQMPHILFWGLKH